MMFALILEPWAKLSGFFEYQAHRFGAGSFTYTYLNFPL